MKKQIFEIDVKGFRDLQAGKPKWFILRELLQNAMDEPINECKISLAYEGRKATIKVEDDSPMGFRNLSDAYTLFADTYKRKDASKRGRFNLGEKQVICLCAIYEAKKIHGDKFEYGKHIEEHLTDVFNENS